jgi:DNA-binding transcriptional regulator YiaG
MSNAIEKLRNNLGMSRKDFAKYLKTSVGAVSNYEYGTRLPKPSITYKIIDLASRHGISISFEDIYPREAINSN